MWKRLHPFWGGAAVDLEPLLAVARDHSRCRCFPLYTLATAVLLRRLASWAWLVRFSELGAPTLQRLLRADRQASWWTGCSYPVAMVLCGTVAVLPWVEGPGRASVVSSAADGAREG